MNKCTERLYNGIIKENPTFILMLGMCPTLATTTSAINGLGMGLSTTAVLMFSNLIISPFEKDHSGPGAYSGLHRDRGQPGYHRTALNAGLRSQSLTRPWASISR